MEFSQFDWTVYWFMFPVALCVATTATFSGIAGSALFAPIFMVVFPLLGPAYEFPSLAAAIGVALLTTTFGLSSGVVTYLRRRLIDFRSAVPFILVAVPIGILGAYLLAVLKVYEEPLRAAYALLMAVLALYLFRRDRVAVSAATRNSEPLRRPMRTIVERDGTTHTFEQPRQGKGAIATATGAFLTGLLGVGIGEVVMPQLVRVNRVPVPVAAGTSLFVVVLVVASASFTQVSTLVAAGGLAAVPWNVVLYTVPAVLIGGQIGPRLQGKLPHRAVERAIAGLFAIIAVAMGYVAIRNAFFA